MSHSPFHSSQHGEPASGLFDNEPATVIDWYSFARQRTSKDGKNHFWEAAIQLVLQDDDGIERRPFPYAAGFLNQVCPSIGDMPTYDPEDHDGVPDPETIFREWVESAELGQVEEAVVKPWSEARRGNSIRFIPPELRTNPKAKRRPLEFAKDLDVTFLMRNLENVNVDVDKLWAGDTSQIIGKRFLWSHLPNPDNSYQKERAKKTGESQWTILVPVEALDEADGSEGDAGGDQAAVVLELVHGLVKDAGSISKGDLAAAAVNSGSKAAPAAMGAIMDDAWLTANGFAVGDGEIVTLAG